MNISISVIIPIYNMSSTLSRCLDSIFSQSLPNIEIIVIDDGSTDNTICILDTYVKIHPNLVVKKQSNAGSGVARNYGIDIAKGEYIIFMDADDTYPDNDTLKLLYSTAKDHGVNICGGKIKFLDHGKCGIFRGDVSDSFFNNAFVDVHSYTEIYGHQRFLLKTDFIRSNNIKYTNLSRYQDQHLVISALAKAGGFWAVNKVVYNYYVNEKEITYSFNICRDILLGIADALKLVKSYRLSNMYYGSLRNIYHDYIIPFCKYSYYDHEIIDKTLDEINGYMKTWENDSYSYYLPHKSSILAIQRKYKQQYKAILNILTKGTPVIIYGAGNNAKLLIHNLSNYLDNVIGIAVTNTQADVQEYINGIPVRLIVDYLQYREKISVLVGTSKIYTNEIVRTLKNLGFINIYTPDINPTLFEIGAPH